jgi:isopentenyl phosphate kinase
MTQKHLVCLKIGGSIITDKSKPATPNIENIATFADNLASALGQFPGYDVLLGNGAGSFGHHSAHEYGLRDGASSKEQFYGVDITHNSVRELNLLVGNALTSRGIPAYCLSPGDIFSAKNGEVLTANKTVVEELLRHHSLPLIHGDTVLDTERGVSIFSTEQSLFWLAEALRSHYDRITVVMVVNTGGVLDKDGGVITELTRDATVEVAQKIAGIKDVTGGITHKVTTCRKAADWADAVYIIGNTEQDLAAVFAGTTAGTKVL